MKRGDMVAVGCSIVDYKERERKYRDETGMCVHVCSVIFALHTATTTHNITHRTPYTCSSPHDSGLCESKLGRQQNECNDDLGDDRDPDVEAREEQFLRRK